MILLVASLERESKIVNLIFQILKDRDLNSKQPEGNGDVVVEVVRSVRTTCNPYVRTINCWMAAVCCAHVCGSVQVPRTSFYHLIL